MGFVGIRVCSDHLVLAPMNLSMRYNLVETQFPHMWNGGKNAYFIGSLWGPNEIKFSPLSDVWDPRVYGEWCQSKALGKNGVNHCRHEQAAPSQLYGVQQTVTVGMEE